MTSRMTYRGLFNIYRKIQKTAGQIDHKRAYVHYVHTQVQLAKSCKMTVAGTDFHCLLAFKYLPGHVT